MFKSNSSIVFEIKKNMKERTSLTEVLSSISYKTFCLTIAAPDTVYCLAEIEYLRKAENWLENSKIEND